MKDQGGAVVEGGDEIFGAPGKALDAAAAQLFGEVFRERDAQVRSPQFNAQDARADQSRLESASDGFDLGQFGHFIPFSTVSERDR